VSFSEAGLTVCSMSLKHVIMRRSLRGRNKYCTQSVRPSVRPSRASDFLETGKPQKLPI